VCLLAFIAATQRWNKYDTKIRMKKPEPPRIKMAWGVGAQLIPPLRFKPEITRRDFFY
jgi:hypothetical protein